MLSLLLEISTVALVSDGKETTKMTRGNNLRR